MNTNPLQSWRCRPSPSMLSSPVRKLYSTAPDRTALLICACVTANFPIQ